MPEETKGPDSVLPQPEGAKAPAEAAAPPQASSDASGTWRRRWEGSSSSRIQASRSSQTRCGSQACGSCDRTSQASRSCNRSA